MILELRIDNYDQLENGGPVSKRLDGHGLSVGRKTADWILPDPSRFVSSHHFDIEYRDGAYWLRDVSMNGTFLQGQRHRLEGELLLRGGEKLVVGHYILSVSLDVPQPAPPPEPEPQPAPPPPDPEASAEPPPAYDDDYWGLAGGPLDPVNPLPKQAAGRDPFEDVARDFMSFAPPKPPAPAPETTGLSLPPQFGAGPSGAETPGGGIQSPGVWGGGTWTNLGQLPNASQRDAVAGLQAPPTADPQAWPAASQPPGGFGPAGLQGAPGPAGGAPRDAGAPPPGWPPDPQAGYPVPPDPRDGYGTPPGPPGQSWSGPAGENAAAPYPQPPHQAEPPPYPAVDPRQAPQPAPPLHAMPPGEPPPRPSASQGQAAATPGSGTPEALVRAFCDGAGLDPAMAARVDPEILMHTLGQCTRITTGQIMAMLHARSEVKKFTRGGQRTMLRSTANNPMKFLPDSQQALEGMFLVRRDGFMGAAEAFDDALTDVRTHQEAVFMALQPALADLLEGLAPDAIEQDETTGNLLGGGRKAKLWARFVERWDDKAQAGENGMLDAFLEAFAKAYADAVARRGGDQ